MHELPLLKDIVILLAASILTSLFFYRLKLPTIIGFILGGIVIGPFGIGLINEIELIDVMAEIGVVLLLFTIGIEFSVPDLMKIGARGLAVAIFQIVITALAIFIMLRFLDMPAVESIFLGFVIALSSTAIVLRLYTDRGEMESQQGKLSLGILLTQDVAIVPIVLFIQIFSAKGDASLMEVGKAFGIVIMAVAAIIITAYYIVPVFLHQVVNLKSPEILTMASILVCLGTAWVSSNFGLSLALGAFIAGMVISESEYSHQITASILPFRDIFNSIFFISIGMLIRPDQLLVQWIPVLLFTLFIVFFKSIVTAAIIYLMRYPLRIAFIVGLSLAQIGEFSFVLLQIGQERQLIDETLYQIFLSSIVLSMILAPLLIKIAPHVSSRLPNLVPRKGEELAEMHLRTSSVINHVIIAGYGLMGRLLAKVLMKTGVPYIILDLNNDNVKKARADGHTAYFGDTSYAEVLRSSGITSAKVMVFAISDPVGTRRGIKIAKELNPNLHIIVRTKYMGEIGALLALGADQVIPEEFETSVEIFARVLKEYGAPSNIIQNQVDLVRLEGYSMLRGISLPMEKMTEISALLAKSVTDSYFVEEESSAADRTIRELNLRGRGGATIIAVVSDSTTKTNPTPDYVIQKGDILVFLGSHAEIAYTKKILQERD